MNESNVKANISVDTTIKPADAKDRVLHVFENTVPSCKMVLKKGKTIHFIAGKFYTDIQEDIDELMEEIRQGNPHLRIPVAVADRTIVAEDLDPMEVLRKKHIAEYLAEQKAAIREDRDLGNSERGNLKVQTSRDVSGAVPDSNTGIQTSNTDSNVKTIKVGPAASSKP